MPFARVNPGDLIQAQNLDQLVDSFNGVSGKGIPVAETSVNDATNYALSVQNLEATNSRALNVLKSDGSLLIRADVNGVSIGTPFNPTAGSIQGTALANATVTNANLGPDVTRANRLTNGGMEFWQRGNGPFTASGAMSADRWQPSLGASSSISISRDGTNVDTGSGAAAALTYTHAAESYLYQNPEDIAELAGRTVSLSVRARTTTANAVRPFMQANGSNTFGAYHPGGGTYQTLTLTLAVPAGTTSFIVGVALDASSTVYLDNTALVIGTQPANYVPLVPAEDWARCLRYYEVLGPGGTGSLIISGIATAGGQSIRAMFRWSRKASVPTVTKNSTWTTSNCGQPTLYGPDLDGCYAAVTASAAGDTYSLNSPAGCNITVEGN
jgi:hypothetical protein